MFRSHLVVLPLALVACNSSELTDSQVQIVSSTPASELALIGGEMKPFWQVSIDRKRIFLNGAAAPKGSGSIEAPLVEPTVNGSDRTWVFDTDGQRITIKASRAECVRSDGFRFPVTVRVSSANRQLTGCGETGADL